VIIDTIYSTFGEGYFAFTLLLVKYLQRFVLYMDLFMLQQRCFFITCYEVGSLFKPLLTIYMIENGKSILSILCFAGCVCLNLIPLPLIEFRYFIIPFLILNLLIYTPNKKQLEKKKTPVDTEMFSATLINILIYSVVNVLTYYMFLYRPFTAPDGSEARLMW
jgi:hypothetical protein